MIEDKQIKKIRLGKPKSKVAANKQSGITISAIDTLFWLALEKAKLQNKNKNCPIDSGSTLK